MFEEIGGSSNADTEEGTQLRGRLLWLAWDLGEELTNQIERIRDASALQVKLRARDVPETASASRGRLGGSRQAWAKHIPQSPCDS